MGEPVSCLQCGKCCFVDLTAYAEQRDFDRWHAENRHDILENDRTPSSYLGGR